MGNVFILAFLQILQPATVIVVSVTASTSQGEMLTPEELDAVYEACQMATLLQV
jgi:U4/U6 small nuclear ribonucleoprotein PRP31